MAGRRQMRHRFAAHLITAGLMLLMGFAQLPGLVANAHLQEAGRILGHPEVKSLPSKEKRWALIIGIDSYEDENITPLRGATNDANTLAQVLQGYAGFDEDRVIVLTNEQGPSRRPTRNNILKYLSNLKTVLPKDGLLLVAFSGHGIERDGHAFLIPGDAVYTEDIALLQSTAISVEEMTKGIKATGVNQALILLDACRSDPLSGKADSVNPLTGPYVRAFNFDLENKEISAFAVLYATSVGARAYEDVDRREGYFTLAVAEALRGRAADPKSGKVTLQNLVKYIQETVPLRVATNLGGNKVQKPFAVIGGYKADELVLAIRNPGTSEPMLRNTRSSKSGRVVIFNDDSELDNPELSKEFTKRFGAMLRGNDLVVRHMADLDARERAIIDNYFQSRGSLKPEETAFCELPYAFVVEITVRVSDLKKENDRYVAEALISVCAYNTKTCQCEDNLSVLEGIPGFGSTREKARRNAVHAAAEAIPDAIIISIAEKAKKT